MGLVRLSLMDQDWEEFDFFTKRPDFEKWPGKKKRLRIIATDESCEEEVNDQVLKRRLNIESPPILSL